MYITSLKTHIPKCVISIYKNMNMKNNIFYRTPRFYYNWIPEVAVHLRLPKPSKN